ERSKLQEMALNHIPQRPGRFVEGGPLLHTEAFRSGDLHVVHVIAIPKGLEDAVPKSQRQKILNRIFPQEVIDAIDLRLIEGIENRGVEFSRRGKVTAK